MMEQFGLTTIDLEGLGLEVLRKCTSCSCERPFNYCQHENLEICSNCDEYLNPTDAAMVPMLKCSKNHKSAIKENELYRENGHEFPLSLGGPKIVQKSFEFDNFERSSSHSSKRSCCGYTDAYIIKRMRTIAADFSNYPHFVKPAPNVKELDSWEESSMSCISSKFANKNRSYTQCSCTDGNFFDVEKFSIAKKNRSMALAKTLKPVVTVLPGRYAMILKPRTVRTNTSKMLGKSVSTQWSSPNISATTSFDLVLKKDAATSNSISMILSTCVATTTSDNPVFLVDASIKKNQITLADNSSSTNENEHSTRFITPATSTYKIFSKSSSSITGSLGAIPNSANGTPKSSMNLNESTNIKKIKSKLDKATTAIVAESTSNGLIYISDVATPTGEELIKTKYHQQLQRKDSHLEDEAHLAMSFMQNHINKVTPLLKDTVAMVLKQVKEQKQQERLRKSTSETKLKSPAPNDENNGSQTLTNSKSQSRNNVK